MRRKSMLFALAAFGIYVAWALLAGMVLALTPISFTWLCAISGLLLGLLPMTYNLIGGRRPSSTHLFPLTCGLIAFIAFTICLSYLGDDYSDSLRLIALTAGYLIGLSWYDGDARTLAKVSVVALVLTAAGTAILCTAKTPLLSNPATRRLGMSASTYFEMALALLLGFALPLPKLARRMAVPLTIFAAQLIIVISALLAYSGALKCGFTSFCARLVIGQVTAYSYWLYLGIAGMLLKQVLAIALPRKQSDLQSAA